MQSRYEMCVQLAPANLLPLLENAAPQIGWLDTGELIYRRHDGVVVVDPQTGERRDATPEEAPSAPPELPAIYPIRNADPRPPFVASPDGRHELHQEDGNLVLGGAKLTTDGSPDNGYGIYHGNWKAGFVQRQRAAGPYPPFGVTWTPDSRRVIVPRIDQSHVAIYPYLETAPGDGSLRPHLYEARVPIAGEEPVRIEWHVFDVEDGSHTRLQFPDGLLFLHQDLTALRTVTFSSDASHAYVVAHGAHMASAHLFDVDLSDGSVREVIVERETPRADLNTTSYQPPNVAVVGDMDRVVWWSQRSGWGHLYLYDGASGSLLHPITSGEWLVRDIVCVDGERIFFTGSGREPGNPYLRRLYRAGLDGSDLTLLSPEDADCEVDPSGANLLRKNAWSRAVSPDGQHVAYTVSTVSEPPRTVLRRTSDASLVETLEVCEPAPGYRAPEEFVTTAADGETPIYGVLWKPPDFDPSEKYPVLVTQYASPLMAATPRNYRGGIVGPPGLLSPGSLAALGLVCICLDARGTTGRSKAFSDAGYGRLHIIGLDDYAAAIGQLAAQHGWFDSSRVGIVGSSYGGYTTVRAMIEFPDVFHAGIADAPLAVPHAVYPDYHWFAFHGVPSYDGAELRPDPARVPDNYLNVDAASQADRLKGHMLVAVAELDENCPPSGAMPFVLAAQEANKNVDLIFMPNATHYTLLRTRYAVRRHLDFLTRHLLGVEPPADADLAALDQRPEPATRATPEVW